MLSFRVAVQQPSYFRTPLLISLGDTSHRVCLNVGHGLGALPPLLTTGTCLEKASKEL